MQAKGTRGENRKKLSRIWQGGQGGYQNGPGGKCCGQTQLYRAGLGSPHGRQGLINHHSFSGHSGEDRGLLFTKGNPNRKLKGLCPLATQEIIGDCPTLALQKIVCASHMSPALFPRLQVSTSGVGPWGHQTTDPAYSCLRRSN